MATTAQRQNPIERRLDKLSELWESFAANPEARLLRWLVDDEDMRMVQLFADLYSEGLRESADLFIRLNSPFTGIKEYAAVLIEEMKKQYASSREVLREENIPSDWFPFEGHPGESGPAAFAGCCTSFHHYHQELMIHLAVALIPSHNSDPKSWERWLDELLRTGLPTHVRIIVLERKKHPILKTLADALPKLVYTSEPNLNMGGAMQEIADGVPGTGPGYDFRRSLVTLTNAAGKGSLDPAERAAATALQVAKAENWPDMQMVVHLCLGGAYLGQGQHERALAAYRQGRAAAEQAKRQNHPAGEKLQTQAHFAEAGCLVAMGAWREAATIYSAAAPLAAGLQDHLMTLEAWRMAAYCYEQAKEAPEAWRCNHEALAAGERMEAGMRGQSTLPYVGQAMLRLVSQHRAGKRLEKEVRQRMETLVGPDWEDHLAQGVPS